MTVYFVTALSGWGAGETAEQALEEYRKFNGRIPKGGKYRLTAIETPMWENISMGEFDMTIKPPAKMLYQKDIKV